MTRLLFILPTGYPCNVYVEASQHDRAFDVALGLAADGDLVAGLKAAGIYAVTREELLSKAV